MPWTRYAVGGFPGNARPDATDDGRTPANPVRLAGLARRPCRLDERPRRGQLRAPLWLPSASSLNRSTRLRGWTGRACHNLLHFNALAKGGHFAAWEQPERMTCAPSAVYRASTSTSSRASGCSRRRQNSTRAPDPRFTTEAHASAPPSPPLGAGGLDRESNLKKPSRRETGGCSRTRIYCSRDRQPAKTFVTSARSRPPFRAACSLLWMLETGAFS
jgi:hypothetical protein